MKFPRKMGMPSFYILLIAVNEDTEVCLCFYVQVNQGYYI